MRRIHHLNCVKIVTPFNDNVTGHCLLIEEDAGLLLIDTGLGIQDIEHPDERLGNELIKAVGFQLNHQLTAFHQMKTIGLAPSDVKHCVISHLDPDHTGGLADFPSAKVHVSKEELMNFNSGNLRYLPQHLNHNPEIEVYDGSTENWFGMEARRVRTDFETEILLIPLFGHTAGHCGVALRWEEKWILYGGDAYYIRAELEDENHPAGKLAEARADNNTLRLESMEKIKKLIREHPEIKIFGYHDYTEFSGW